MKKLLLTALVMMAATSSFADPSGTLTISGEVLAINDIVITPTADATKLDIEGGNTTGLLVASVEETSNNYTGYTITMKSANSGLLVNQSYPSSTFAKPSTAYTIAYANDTYVDLALGETTVKTVSGPLSSKSVVDSDVKVKVAAKADAPAGVYSDVVTIKIVANN